MIGAIISAYLSGDRDAAKTGYGQVLPVINPENRQVGFRAANAAMLKGKVIKSDFCRHPVDPLHPQTKSSLFDLMEPLNPIVLRWGH